MPKDKEAVVVLVDACNEALDADNVFTGEGTLARRKIRSAVEGLEEVIAGIEAAAPAEPANADAEPEQVSDKPDITPKPTGSGTGGASSGPGASKSK